MDDSALTNLLAGIQEDPKARANEGLLEELVLLVLDCMNGPAVPDRRSLALATGEIAERFRSSLGESSEVWTAWHAGQVQGLATLLECSLAREIPARALALLKRKHVPALLEALSQGDRTLSELAHAVGIDLSQADRVVTEMAERNFVRTMKDGRVRWVTLTVQGQRAMERQQSEHIQRTQVAAAASARPLEPEAVSTRSQEALSTALLGTARSISAQQAELAQSSRETRDTVREIADLLSGVLREMAEHRPETAAEIDEYAGLGMLEEDAPVEDETDSDARRRRLSAAVERGREAFRKENQRG